jgi:gamma-glutamylcyclotransferase
MNDAVKPKTIRYFAYGSNMFTPRLQERTPSAAFESLGYVEGHRLIFSKVSTDGSGKCHIEATGNVTDRVHGVVFTIAADEKPDLDKAEGLGRGYKEEKIQVVTPQGVIEAVAYIAIKTGAGLHPYDWYKAFVVAGAEEYGLPAAYIDDLRAVSSMPDLNKDRAEKQRAILSRAIRKPASKEEQRTRD